MKPLHFPFSLTLVQQDIYFDQLKRPNSPMYNIGGYIRLPGINVQLIQQAHQQLVTSDAIFGLRIQATPEGPMQSLSDEADTRLPIHDFSYADVPETEANAWVRQQFSKPIEMHDSPLFRTCLLKLNEQSFFYVGYSHHLLMDGWGFSNWARKLGKIYNGANPSNADWTAISDQDASYQSSKRYLSDKEFWLAKDNLIAEQRLLPHHQQSFNQQENVPSNRLTCAIPSGLTQVIHRFCQQYQQTPATVLLSLTAVYLSKVYGHENVVLGLPVHNRRNHEQKNMLGVFTSMSPMPLSVADNISFAEFVAYVSNQQKLNFRHQRYPVGHMIKDRQLQGLNRGLFDIAFNYLRLNSDLSFDGKSADLVYQSHYHEQLPMTLNVWQYGESEKIELQFDYNYAFFDDVEAEQLAQRLLEIGERLLAQPNTALGKQDYLTIVDRKKQLESINETISEESNRIFHQRIKQHLGELNNKVIARSSQEQLTASELLLQSAHWADIIASALPGKQHIISICMPPGPSVLVAQIAILRSGNVFLPIDPKYPEERLQFILNDSQCRMIMSHSSIETVLSSLSNCPVQLMDQAALPSQRTTSQDVNARKDAEISATDLAYVIYTSGSTGQPKGVMIQHSALCNLMDDQLPRFGLSESSQMLQTASFGFDAAVWDWCMALCAGAELHFVEQNQLLDNHFISNYVQQRNISYCFAPPSLLAILPRNAFSGVKTVVTGGEAISISLAREWAEDRRFFNAYGPTENTIVATLSQIPADTKEINIGEAIKGVHCLVLGQQQQLLAKGCVGELYLGGVALAKGYLNREELTAERFIPHPWAKGQRLYRTGDLVRYTSDDQLQFIGRTDNQVKIRGFRIELGEIEQQLQAVDGVKEAVVITRENLKQQMELVAYITATQEAVELVNHCQDSLSRQLPPYMLPQHYMRMDSFPLTPNGKVNRKGLPAPTSDVDKSTTGDDFSAPMGDTEKILCRIWADLLGRNADTISGNHNFFTLGGHSLQAVRLSNQIRSEMEKSLTVKDIFENPVLRDMADIVQTQSTSSKRPPIIAKEFNGPQPLSFAQQRLWLLDQVEGSSARYNMPGALYIEGDFDFQLASKALYIIAERHSILRTVYQQGVDAPQQRVLDASSFEIDITDLSQDAAADDSALTLAQEYASRTFDLSKDTMFRVHFVRLPEKSGIARGKLLLNMHHIAGDGWSVAILIREFTSCYAALKANRHPVLPALSVQYRDFACWQRDYLKGETRVQQLGYWQQQLDGAPAIHSLPLDKPRPQHPSWSAGYHSSHLNANISSELDTLAMKFGITRFMLLHAAFSLMLARHSNASDVLIGTPVANRLVEEVTPLIGCFVNTLVLRSQCQHQQTLKDYLQHIRQVNLQAQENQDMPFEQIVEFLDIVRSTSHAPLFQVMLSMDTTEQAELSIEGLNLSLADIGSNQAKFDLELAVSEQNDSLAFVWTFAEELFEEQTIARFDRHLHNLLNAMVESIAASEKGHDVRSKEITLDQLSMFDLKEQQDLLDFEQTQLPQERRLHALFSAQANARPDAIALNVSGLTTTYGELATRSARWTYHLRSLGIGSDTLVGIAMARNSDMVAALLAVLQAGGTFVPLDPNYPQERLTYMLEDSEISVLLTDNSLTVDIETNTVCLTPEQLDELCSQYPETAPEDNTQPEDLAYVIYTSGSTGHPKGVAISHASVTAMLYWARETFTTEQCARILAATSLNFDLSIFEIFLPLSMGTQCVMVKNSLSLLDEDVNVSLINTVPSAIQALLSQQAIPQHVKVINLAGEPLDFTLVNALLEGGHCQEVNNLYGPSEDTTYSTHARLTESLESATPIGRVLSNSQACLLAPDGSLSPYGSIGELYLGGLGLAREYLNRPELTSERFVTHPWSEGQRLYRTGDLVRYRNDGQLGYIGRIDDQVKIRGFRIELGEIEQQLQAVDCVKEAAVIARDDNDQPLHLVAYITVMEGFEDATAECQSNLAQYLPSYMLPQLYVQMDELPLTPNGKVNRKALPIPNNQTDVQRYQEHEGVVEPKLAHIWAELLGRQADSIGAVDDFFSLGGHSLLAVRLSNKVRSVFGRNLLVREVFEHPTLRDMAVHIDTLKTLTGRPPLKTMQTSGPLPLSFAQQRLWLLDQLDGQSARYNMPGSLEIEGEFDVKLAAVALSKIIERHTVLRTVYLQGEKAPHQKVRGFEGLTISTTDLSLDPLAEEKSRQLALEHASWHFDLGQDLMLRAHFLKMPERNNAPRGHLLLSLHHIAGDGWSIGILIKEFTACYAALKVGINPVLPPLSVQYSDYASWQQNYLQGEIREEQLSYWQTQLDGAPSVHSIPMDNPRPQNPDWDAGYHISHIESQLRQRLDTLAGQFGITRFMLIHAALGLMISRHSNADDVLIGTPVANRLVDEVAPLIGCFVNTLVLRTRCQRQQTLQNYIEHIRQVNLQAQEHQDMPFEQIVEELDVARSTNHAPLFQVMLSMDNNERDDLSIDGLNMALMDTLNQKAKFDLELAVSENDSGLCLTWTYAKELISDASIARFDSHLRNLLQAIEEAASRGLQADISSVANLNVTLDQISMFGYQEQQQLLDFKQTTLPQQRLLHGLFCQQAQETPNAIALEVAGQLASYKELATRSARWAQHLRKLGIHREALVGISMSRNADMVTALLAVLQAGGAFVPLDPNYPQERLNYMLQDSKVAIWLVDENLENNHLTLDPDAECVRLSINLLDKLSAKCQETIPDNVTQPEDLAYVIYTSGSTGKPKGVAITHANVTAMLYWAQEAFTQAQCDRILAATSLNFDLSIFEIFLPLSLGTRCVMVDNALSLIESEVQVSLINTVPSAMQALLHQNAIPDGVQAINLAGEPLDFSLVNALLEGEHCQEVNNLYGPSEDTTYSTHARLTSPLHGATPIGQVLSNSQACLLAPDGSLSPYGCIGELYIGGAGLARQYLNLPELTTERFVPHPWEQGARLYRTGDLVRYGQDQQLQYIGRIDNQVKIRGFRIELGEIEQHLQALREIKEAVVVAREDHQQQQHLVAYVTTASDIADVSTFCRDALSKHLPAYMLPQLFVLLEKLPLTPNGKVDRKVLPAPSESELNNHQYVAPRNEVEAELCEIWSEVLGQYPDSIGVEQNFFTMGGNSLQAIQLLGRLKDYTDTEFNIRELFERPTISHQAELILEQEEATPASSRFEQISNVNDEQTEELVI